MRLRLARCLVVPENNDLASKGDLFGGIVSPHSLLSPMTKSRLCLSTLSETKMAAY